MVRIIKAVPANPQPADGSGETGSFIDVGAEVRSQLEIARNEAARIVQQAHEQADSIRREARRKGARQATQAIQQQVRQEVDRRVEAALPALEEAVRAIGYEKARHLKHRERHVIRLAAAIAERLVRRELSRFPEITLDLIREALDLAAGSERIKLHLNPTDYQTLGERVGALTARLSETAALEVVADPAVSPGGCCLQTEFGDIDQRFETQLARIEEELT